MLEPNGDLSIRCQCELLGISRSGVYYKHKGECAENQIIMRRLDEMYTETPFYGVVKMTQELRNLGYKINKKRVRRLLRKMGLFAIYPQPKMSIPNPEHVIYPYLLRGVKINEVDQVWSTDITYIRLEQGFAYLMAIVDWYSRYVITWSLSQSMEADFCIEALQEALENRQCKIFNTDQGAQFTTPRFTRLLLDRGIQVSMDGRGRALDNVFVERLWRTVKYEKVYLCEMGSMKEARRELRAYFDFYNHKRIHQSLDYSTPAQVYNGEAIASPPCG